MRMKTFHSAALAFLIVTTPARAEQETRPHELFTDMACDEVETRAGEIMLDRQISARYDAALRFMQKTRLDRALIDDAFRVGHKVDSREIFAAIDDFRDRWRAICNASIK